MRFKYPLKASETLTYSTKVNDYRRLTKDDKRTLVNNFKEFYKYCFWYQNLPMPTRDQLFMAKHMAKLALSKDRVPSMLQAQRGLAKSLTVQLLSVWLLLRNKNEKIVVVSATGRRSESFTLFCLNLLKTIPILQHLQPNTDQRSSGNKFDVAGRIIDDSPSVTAFGVTSAKSGSRATFIIYDDVEVPENSATAQMREKLLDGVRDTANLGVSGVFRELCICTPQSGDSVYNTLQDEDGFKCIVLPSEYPEDLSVYGERLAPHIERITRRQPELVGLNTDKRQDMAHLMQQKVKGKARYKLQYMLDTTLSDIEKYPLKLADLIVMDLDSEKAPTHIEYGSEKRLTLYDIKHSGFRGDFIYQPRYFNEQREAYEGIAMFIDPSGRGTDETTYCVTAHLGGKIFVLALAGVKGGYNLDTLTLLANKAKEYKVNIIQIESNFGDGAFAELLKPVVKPIHHCMIEDVRATTQKETRIINTLEPVMMQHRLVINKQVMIQDQDKKDDYKFTYQLTHITNISGSLKHDDLVDVLEMGVKYWQVTMARDQGEEVKRHREALIDKELEAHMSLFGLNQSVNNVMDSW